MKLLFVLATLLALCLAALPVEREPWMNPQDDPGARARALLAQMTLDEKLSMVHGYGGPYVGNVNAIDRLKIPALHLEDGPQGVADGVQKTTCWPGALAVVSTWDTALMTAWASALGREQRMKGTNIMLGPMMNIARVPFGGRNFESFGEDPYLASAMAAASVSGIQSQGVLACAKHYVDNNQEYHRFTVSENVDERTNHEIYLPAFKASADAGVGSFMCAYNKINNVYACENNYTLNTVLKEMWKYPGFVMSDWGATHSTVLAANSGLDMQMPDASFFGTPLKNAVANGQVPQRRIDDMVVRILTPMFAVGLFDNPQTGDLGVDSRSAEHTALARKISASSTVLLKNAGNLLPLDASKIKSIAVLGDDGNKSPIIAGGGSGHVDASYVIDPFNGIKNRAGAGVEVKYAPTNPIDSAVALAKASDIAIVFAGTTSSEGSDRSSLSLGNNQDELIEAVIAAQPHTIVVVHTPGSLVMPWADKVPAILNAWMPGQEDGNAIADVLFGDVNPAARLTVTFPVTEKEIPVNTQQQYPGINDQADYSEGLLVGYRWYDAKNVVPLFPFGHGLSYTTFGYYNLRISGRQIKFDVKNLGQRDGAEVPQLYLGFPASTQEPPKVLRRFSKVQLTAGQTQTITYTLTDSDLSIWDANKHNWSLVSGTFGVFVGASSRDIRLKGSLVV